jgi:hypothetical protein
MKSYKIIANDDIIEARIYKPVKRTIIVSNNSYFLQFPEIIAVKVRLEVTPSCYWDMYDSHYYERPSAFLAVNMVYGKFIYNIPLPQVNYTANKLGVCLNHESGHVFCPIHITLDDMMNWFWFTAYHADGNIEYSRFSSFHNWSTLDLAGVIDLLKHIDPRCTIDDYLEELREASRKVSKGKKKNEYQATVQDGDS